MKTLTRSILSAIILLGIVQTWPAHAGSLTNAVPSAEEDSAVRTIGLAAAAAFAIGLSVAGAAYAVARIGSAALGTAAEKPELLTRSLVFVALAEGLAVLGFAIAAMLIQKI